MSIKWQKKNQVTSRKLAEENQVTTKDPRKVEQGKRLAESNRIKREAKKGAENGVTANKMAEENQIQQVTTKDPRKVAQGKKLAESNHIKREVKKSEVTLNQYDTGVVLAVGVIGCLGYYLYQNKKGEDNVVSPPPPQPQPPQ